MRVIKRTVTAAICALAATPVAAQTVVQPTPRLDFGISIDEIYDTNVARVSDEAAEVRGLEQEDLRVTPAVTVDALILLGRQTLAINGFAGYDFYNSNTRLNRERIGINGALGLSAAGCTGQLTAGYTRRQSDLADLLIIGGDPNDESLVSNTEEIKTVGASALCGREFGLKPTASITHTWADNSTEFRQFSDFRSTVASGGLAYGRPVFGLLTVFATVGRTTFPNRVLGLDDEEDGFDQGSVGARYERSIGSRLRGSGEVSYTRVDPDRGGVGGFGGLTWNLSLTGTFSRLQLTGLVSRAVQASNRLNASYYIDKLYSLNADYALSPRLTLSGGVLQRERDFRGSGQFVVVPGLVFGPVLDQDRTRAVNAGLKLQWSRLVTLVLTAVHEEREANGSFFDYTSNRFGLGARVRF